MTAAPGLVLASASPARAAILKGAGLRFVRDPADIDESAIKEKRRLRGDADGTAAALAAAKAKAVSARHPGALVLGADQILECGGVWFDKPADLAEAATQLKALRGRSHDLVTAAAVVRDGRVLWDHGERARLTVRPFSSVFLDDYLKASGKTVLASVGAYRFEGRGAQLFSRIDGDYFTVLGLPLLPLLGFLRFQGVIGD